MRSTPRINPLAMIDDARNRGVLYELDTECITNAIQAYPHSYLKNHYLFLNIFPSTIIHEQFENFITDLLLKFPNMKEMVVFEINETHIEENIWGQFVFLKRLAFLKSLGFRIAFDDLSVNRASLKKMELLSPDFVKLDPAKSKDLSDSIDKQELILLFLEFTHEKMKLVLEGIETRADLLAAKKLGVPLLQGYYISKPQRL
ncbi:EAL domain-containing protein (putative c-di-GMP-specific phosphodiesterase class I) [Robertmurraya andreesenii]|uniref:EAL domain-containing protein (Putative c-di-GMP-specific phosphodiesterase class I) n=2 Tax=Anoxybacillus andreesenii TaxID=1325932 RepID=A0ABT9VAB2_9BACL|nr:EAL domain-containing protein (putative c-di-GMP-specific phosphodiesterase class I) [Robertmurraya andreesenii]